MRNIANKTSPYPLQKGDFFLLVILNGACVVKNLECIAQLFLVHVLEILPPFGRLNDNGLCSDLVSHQLHNLIHHNILIHLPIVLAGGEAE